MASRRAHKGGVEAVQAQGTWCCMSYGLPSSTYGKEYPKPRDAQKGPASTKPQQKVSPNKQDRPRRSLDLEKAGGEALKSGEITNLIKPGVIGGGVPGNSSPFKIRGSPGRVSPMVESSPHYANLNTLLTTGLLNQPSPPLDMGGVSPTLYEMIANEQNSQEGVIAVQGPHNKQPSPHRQGLVPGSPGTLFNDPASCDLKLTLSNKDGFNITVNVHSQILVAHSRFFAAQFSERQSKEHHQLPHHIEVSECEDIEVYLDTLRLMYCSDLRKSIVKQSVTRVLGMLKVCTAIVFEAGVLSCLEYLEAVPWPEEDEEKVTSLLLQLRLESIGAGEVLKRLSTDDPSGSEDVLVGLVHLVTKGTDEKARREMKSLVSRMLRENAAQGSDLHDLSKDSLYLSCQGCFESLLHYFTQASSHELAGAKQSEDRVMMMAQIVRQADNLNWLVDILIDRQIADEFVKIWAFQTDLATLHGKVPVSYGRYEVSRLTARLCIALGKGQVLAPKDVRFMLLQNWLQPLIDDFGWMQRACKGLDKYVVEEGISQTILTLPLKQQQAIMLSWFDRFLKNGDDCPNLQRAFEIWWRRTFVRPPLELATHMSPT